LLTQKHLCMTQKFDAVSFSKALKTKRVIDLNIGVREASTQMKVDPATISRMENGRTPELKNLLLACSWLGMPVCNFIIVK